jgi:ankyrin repeat protein
MATKTKLNIYELLLLTPEEANKMLWEEIKKNKPDLQFIEDILAYSPVDVNVQNERGYTALILAAEWEKSKCIGLLLDHPKIDVNLPDKVYGLTPLMRAAYYERAWYIEQFLGHPMIDKTIKNRDGKTAWIMASDSIRKKFPKLNPNS